jgi:DNA-binding transcriptional LysR family regulator
VPDDVEIRLLRRFAVVAEELHFSRAAQRLFIAQQALSRDIRRLEDRLGVRLLDRTTRRVTLTPAGVLLSARATEILALYDATVLDLRGSAPSLTVDVVGAGLTPALVLEAARRAAPGVEFFARFHSGPERAAAQLSAGRVEVAFGRGSGLPEGVQRRLVRYEPISVLLPERHPLARHSAIPLESLRGTGPCARAGEHATPDWEHAVLQLLERFDIDPLVAHPHVHGAEELARHLRERAAPVLTVSTRPPVPGAVLRPLVDPAPVFPWVMLWRAGHRHPGIDALHRAVDELTAAHGWLAIPDGAWLPEPERTDLP